MAKIRKSLSGQTMIEAQPKKTRQGCGAHTKYAAGGRKGKRKG